MDEIDAVGRQRGTGIAGGNDEREQTLNQILTEMDGFEGNPGIITIAATNRADVLDPALLRPGRFDRRILVDLPDFAVRHPQHEPSTLNPPAPPTTCVRACVHGLRIATKAHHTTIEPQQIPAESLSSRKLISMRMQGRVAILGVHSRGKPLEEDVDLGMISRRCPGFSGASLANLMNEAAIFAARKVPPPLSPPLSPSLCLLPSPAPVSPSLSLPANLSFCASKFTQWHYTSPPAQSQLPTFLNPAHATGQDQHWQRGDLGCS